MNFYKFHLFFNHHRRAFYRNVFHDICMVGVKMRDTELGHILHRYNVFHNAFQNVRDFLSYSIYLSLKPTFLEKRGKNNEIHRRS